MNQSAIISQLEEVKMTQHQDVRVSARSLFSRAFGGRMLGAASAALVASAFMVSAPLAQAAVSPEGLRIVGNANPVQVFVPTQNNSGLDISDFQLREDGSSQTLVSAEPNSSLPFVTVFVMDYSPSVRNNETALKRMEEAAKGFVSLMQPKDKAAVIKFNDRVEVMGAGLTSNHDTLNAAIDSIPPQRGYSKLYDAISKAIEVSNCNPKLVCSIIVLSDGDDVGSALPLADLHNQLYQAGTAVFPIGYGDNINVNKLQELATNSGGAYYTSEDSSQFSAVYERIWARLSNEFMLTYHTAATDCKKHNVEVDVNDNGGTTTYKGTMNRCTPGEAASRAHKGGGGSFGLWELAALFMTAGAGVALQRMRRRQAA
ncbi:hypothetical protein HDN1F_05810 [gamma proteobacterium HdN1]|nr:hypothetical protein HDN1F_05810 [gamma proteobacterium HdN1]